MKQKCYKVLLFSLLFSLLLCFQSFAEKYTINTDAVSVGISDDLYVVYKAGTVTYKAKVELTVVKGGNDNRGILLSCGLNDKRLHGVFLRIYSDSEDNDRLKFGLVPFDMAAKDKSVDNFEAEISARDDNLNYGYLTMDASGWDSGTENGYGVIKDNVALSSLDRRNETHELLFQLLADKLPANTPDFIAVQGTVSTEDFLSKKLYAMLGIPVDSAHLLSDQMDIFRKHEDWNKVCSIMTNLSPNEIGTYRSISSDYADEYFLDIIQKASSISMEDLNALRSPYGILKGLTYAIGSTSQNASHSSQLTTVGGNIISNAANLTLKQITKNDEAEDTNGDSTVVWKNWYIAALTTAAGIEISADNSPLKDIKRKEGGKETSDLLYASYETLDSMQGKVRNESNARYMYEILTLAAMGGRESAAFKKWIGSIDYDKTMKELAIDFAKDGSNVDYTALDGWVQEINNAGTGTDNVLKRFTTIAPRLNALIAASNTKGFDLSDSKFSWITDWYGTNDKTWYVDSSFFSDTVLPMLKTKGTPIYLATTQADGQEFVDSYIIQTLYEIPAFTQFYLKDMNDLISANNQLTDMTLYKAVKSIKTAKDTLDIPLLNLAWEFEVAVPDGVDGSNIQYKSLAKIWEKLNSLAADSEEAEAKDPLATGKPMKWFFKDYQAGILSDYYVQGIAYSAIMEPMRTNVYSTEWLRYLDPEFRSKFYLQWGFNRKALYIDKRSGAVENYFTTGEYGIENGKICTLRDLLNAKNDVVLYIDDNFYNSQIMHDRFTVVSDTGSKVEIDQTMSGEQQTETKSNPWWAHMATLIEETYVTDFNEIVKTGDSTNYSKTFYDLISRVSGSHTYYPDATIDNVGNTDNAVLSSGRINYYLDSENVGSEIYSPTQGYAVVSAIYRDPDLFNKANSKQVQGPVFMASKTAPYMKNASTEACMTIFNYALLQNLEAAMPVGYAGNIDMDCPLYMDIFGNIVTESGTVVVPALSNPTLCNKYEYFMNMWAAGLFSVYGLEYYIPVDDSRSAVFDNVMSSTFTIDDTGKYYIPIPRTVGDDFKVDMSRLSTTNKGTLDTLYAMSYSLLYNSSLSNNPLYNFDVYFQVCMEVLRGAPIENIDKELEGLNTVNRLDRAGIIAAAKLEELNKSLSTGGTNTTLYVPNLAFMPGFTYIAVMAFKIMLLIVVVVNMITIYVDAVSESLGVSTAIKCVMAMFITILVMFTIPAVFEATYYQSNRMLLQDESIRVAMLNQEKASTGVEIGVTEVTEPNTSTKLYVKLEDVEVPWYELFYNSIFTDSYEAIDKIYKNYAQEHSAVANQSDVLIMNDGVYVDLSDIFDSSSVDLDTTITDTSKRLLVQTTLEQDQTFSWYSPYYAILDALIENVNYYNSNPWEDGAEGVNGWYSYTIKELKGGKYKTMGLIAPYFTSKKFLEREGIDPLGLRVIYSSRFMGNMALDPATAQYYTHSNLEAMRKSGWFSGDISTIELEKRLDYMTEQARRFVANNKDLIGKISDDTFLKAMALDMSLKYNNAFGNKYASSIEIYNLSNDDLLRMSMADSKSVMINSTLSYPRFVYTVGDSISVFAAALLSMVMWISGIVKPILVIVAFLTIFVSIFIFKVCARRQDVSLWGYFITILLLSLTNVSYSLMLKASMYLPRLNLTPFMCILLQIVLQIVYMVVLLQVVWTAFRDWHDLGFARYANKAHDFRVTLFNFMHRDKNLNNPFYGGTTKASTPEKNWEYYDDMLDERKRRLR